MKISKPKIFAILFWSSEKIVGLISPYLLESPKNLRDSINLSSNTTSVDILKSAKI